MKPAPGEKSSPFPRTLRKTGRGGKARFGLDRVVKLASNENPLGPSPKALQVLKEMAASAHICPDAAGFAEGPAFGSLRRSGGARSYWETVRTR